MIHDVQAHMLPNECGDSGRDCRRLRHRRRDHAVTRIHDKILFLSKEHICEVLAEMGKLLYFKTIIVNLN